MQTSIRYAYRLFGKKRNRSVNNLLDDNISTVSDDSDYYEPGDSEYESPDSAYESESEVPLLN